jgi:glycosyltransferase involved in cell wall biosynthesis
MAGAPEVSVVMPVWEPDHEWLRSSVNSVLDQSACELELIIVDDGNVEPLERVLCDVDDHRLRILRVPHGGASAARNAGTATANGAYIRYVDADDVLTPDGTRFLLQGADASTIAYGATEVCDDSLTPRYRIESSLQGDAVEACLLGTFDVRHVSMLFPADVVRAAGEWDAELSVCEDWDFVLRCVELAAVRPIPHVVTSYRRHPRSATRVDATGTAWRHGQRRVVEKYLARHPDQRSTPLGRAARARSYRAGAERALAARAFRSYVADAIALTRVAPVAAFAVWRKGARRAFRSVLRRSR